ncbi:MAG: HK97-gp10 family putative phage morphogenesis protein [Faecousia sp.]
MSVPKSVVKINKNGVQYTSSVDKAAYTIVELTRAALRDVGKYLARTANSAAMKLPGLKKSRRVRGRTSTFLYNVPWAESGLPHLEVGVKHGTWYGEQQELGTSNQPKRQILRNSAYDNIAQIVEIESQYLSALEDEAKALSKISEAEYSGGGDD